MADPRDAGFEERITGDPGEWREHVGDVPIGPPPAELSPQEYALQDMRRSPLHAASTLLEFAANFTRDELGDLFEEFDIPDEDQAAILEAASA